MSDDFNLRDYVLKQRETYSLDDIEASLIEQGFDEAMVKDTVAELRSAEGPEIPTIEGGGEPADREDRIKLTLIDALPNGIHALTRPGDFFARMEQKGGYMGPLYTLLFWTVATSLLMALMDLKTKGSVASLVSFMLNVAFGAIPASAIAGVPVMLYTFLFYFLCSVTGGSGSFEASFRAATCMSALMPVYVLTAQFFFPGLIAVLLYTLLVSVYAGVGVHGLTWWRSFFAHCLPLILGIGWLIFAVFG